VADARGLFESDVEFALRLATLAPVKKGKGGK